MLDAIAPEALLLPDGRPARQGWPLRAGFLHLNHGSFGAVPLTALSEQSLLRDEMEALPVSWFITLPERIASARAAIAERLGVESTRLAFVPNATAGASVVYKSLQFPRQSEIVVTNHGYGAVTMGAEIAAARDGARVVTAEIPLGCTADEAHDAVMNVVTDRTALVVVDQITSPTALQLPVATIASSARNAGAQVLVDGAHSPGLIAEPLAGVPANYWTGNLHKWPGAPRGCGVFVADSESSAGLFPVIDSWGTPLEYPERFDHQGTLDVTSYLAASTSWDFIEHTWGWSSVRSYMDELVGYGAAIIADAFSAITGEDHQSKAQLTVCALRLVRLPDGLISHNQAANELRDAMMRETGLQAAFTSHAGTGYVRLSAHAYSTPADYEEFAERIVPMLCNRAKSLGSDHVDAAPLGVTH